jgi:hypothetical protein
VGDTDPKGGRVLEILYQVDRVHCQFEVVYRRRPDGVRWFLQRTGYLDYRLCRQALYPLDHVRCRMSEDTLDRVHLFTKQQKV